MRRESCKAWALTAVLLAMLTTMSRAEQSVGLEAEGVDPSAALHNSLGLDVRDALGRPVSKQVIEQQLARSSQKAAATAAVFNKLKALADMPISAWFAAAVAGALGHGAWAAAPGRTKALLIPFLAIAVLTTAGILKIRRTATQAALAASKPTVLRC